MAYRTERSQALFLDAQKYLAGGVGSGTRAPSSGWVPSPVYVERGQGSHLWDTDENEYVDYLMGGGPLILGHRPQPVIDRVCQTLQERGSMFSLAHDLEIEASRKICECIPSIEKMRFDNSGTSAVQRAIRLARAFTGKTKVVRFEGHYHGWSDQIHWSNRPPLEAAGRRNAPRPIPNSNGIPEVLAETLVVLPWNDVDLLEKTLRAHKDEIACVITEPILGNTGGILPQPGYLQAMRAITAENDIVLIFDEVLTGFRVALGGAQALYGITPDLTTLAKAMAGGFPAAAVGGKAEIMDLIARGEVMYGGTYNSNPIVTSAVITTLEMLRQPGVYERMNSLGERLANGLVDRMRSAGFPACWTGVGAMFQPWFCEPEQMPGDYRAAVPILKSSPFPAFWKGLMSSGVLVQPRQDNLFLLSTAHTAADVEFTLAAAERALAAMR
ncbi:MAG: glutamate-1-semialdehyde 2,1-aminomutase [Chloroflexi bacterium]|nr:glutamate-1-semialdehyde 2,1-aminomutase [Chloroflexota bacterium]